MIEFELVTTKGGDTGETSLYNGVRKRKDDLVFEAVGDLDEFNCSLGPLRIYFDDRMNVQGIIDDFMLHDYLRDIQKIVMNISSQIATPCKDDLYKSLTPVSEADVELLETYQRDYMQITYIGDQFIVPGDMSLISCHIDYARAICRRCERRIVSLIRDEDMRHLIIAQKFMNRLSDFLFVVARHYE